VSPIADPNGQLDRIDQARSGEGLAFATLVEPLRKSLFRHCYRMLASGPEAEDALQDTLLKAWQRLGTFEDRGSFEGWLYRIATNVCIDRLRGAKRRVNPVDLGPPFGSGSGMAATDESAISVEPVADERVGIGVDPEHAALRRERISLAFVSALQRLSPRQRAVLLLHDVLGFRLDEVADVLDASISASNSLLYRARRTISASPITEVVDPDDPAVSELLKRYMRAWELADITQFLATVSDDVRFSMPPLPMWFRGIDDVAEFVETNIFGRARPYGVTMVMGRVNGQPALATYELTGEGWSTVNGLQVLEVVGSPPMIHSITSFRDPDVATRCGFPAGVEK